MRNPLLSPAGASAWARSWAPPTPGVNTQPNAPCLHRTCSPPYTATWGSTPAPSSATSRAARSPSSPEGSRSGNLSDLIETRDETETGPILDVSQIHANVDFDRPGKQQGHLCVPYSYDLGGW